MSQIQAENVGIRFLFDRQRNVVPPGGLRLLAIDPSLLPSRQRRWDWETPVRLGGVSVVSVVGGVEHPPT